MASLEAKHNALTKHRDEGCPQGSGLSILVMPVFKHIRIYRMDDPLHRARVYTMLVAQISQAKQS